MVECKVNQLYVFCCELGCYILLWGSYAVASVLVGCAWERSKQEMKSFIEWCRLSPWDCQGSVHRVRKTESTNKYIKNIVLACDWCYTNNRAGSKDSEWWDRVGGLFKPGGNWDGSKEECRTEKVYPVEKKYQVQMQRVVKQPDKFRETAGAWNTDDEERNGSNHVSIEWADHEEFCVLR